jgi:hypothetical protein
MSTTFTKPAVIVFALILGLFGAAEVAHADSGTCGHSAKEVTFYYNQGSGNCDSKDFSGYGTAKLKSDAPSCCSPASQSGYTAYYYKNRTLQPDDVQKYHSALYKNAAKTSAAFSTSSGSKYHTNVIWDAIDHDQPSDSVSGYAAAK